MQIGAHRLDSHRSRDDTRASGLALEYTRTCGFAKASWNARLQGFTHTRTRRTPVPLTNRVTFLSAGMYRWPDGDEYDGEWRDSKQNGHGAQRLPS